MCNTKRSIPAYQNIFQRPFDFWPPKFVMVNISAKFDEDAHNDLVSIVLSRSKVDAQTDTRNHSSTAIYIYICNKLNGNNNA